MADTDVFLEHFGIRGMKWGIRNKRPQVGGGRRPNRIKRFNRAVERHPFATAAGLGVAGAGVAVGTKLLMQKFASKRVNEWSPKAVLSNPQSQALIDEMKHWRIKPN